MAGRSLLPKEQQETQILAAPSGTLKFQTDSDRMYFQRFQSEIADEILGTFDSPFWTKIVLHACQEEQFVADTVVALSAYMTSRKMIRGCQSDASNAVASQHATFALERYNKAVHLMRTALSNNGDPRKALIGCLLVCCFEGLTGNGLIAKVHALSGQRLLREWLNAQSRSRVHTESFTSPASHVIEDDLLQAAFYFDTQITGHWDTRPIEFHNAMRHEGDETVKNMPASFQTMTEARLYHNLIMRRMMHLTCERTKMTSEGKRQTPADDALLKEDYEGPISIVNPNNWLQGAEGPDETLAEIQLYRQDFLRWRSAFSNLSWKVQRLPDKRSQIACKMLIVLELSARTWCNAMVGTSNLKFDKDLPIFRETVDLSREIIAAKKSFNSSEFFFELGLVPTLGIVARWCRDRALRREAIRLLRWYDATEGIWNSLLMAEMSRFHMEVEEEGVDTDFIPESARVRMEGIVINEEKREAVVRLIRGTKATGETRREGWITW